MEIGRRSIVTLSVPHCRHDPKERNDKLRGPPYHMIERRCHGEFALLGALGRGARRETPRADFSANPSAPQLWT